jgi:hypothetical protein
MKKENMFWGLFFIFAAILLVLGRFHLFAGVGGFKLLLTILFTAIIIRSIRVMNFSGILFPLAFICIIFDRQLGITAITPWTILVAALFCSIGLSILFKKKKRLDWSVEEKGVFGLIEEKEQFEQAAEWDTKCKVHYRTSFGSGIKYVNSDVFKYADLECSFGSMKVFFDNAVIENHATINVEVSFGSIELYIPKTWNVVNQVNVSFAGMEEKNKSETLGSPVVMLTGNLSFSGLEIIYT